MKSQEWIELKIKQYEELAKKHEEPKAYYEGFLQALRWVLQD
jgi:hypothetical protein